MSGNMYIQKLKEAYDKCGLTDEWNHLFDIAHGITGEDKKVLLKEYPDFPKSLMEILEKIDGTYWRKYGDEEVTYYFFGSDVDDGEYPYYLFSVEDILKTKDFDENYGPFIDEKIQLDVDKLKWLNFADCMNNGGTSSLYIDFTPSEKGIKGQIVRYLHDPDEFKVIANSFDEFLDMLIEGNFKFIHEDDFE